MLIAALFYNLFESMRIVGSGPEKSFIVTAVKSRNPTEKTSAHVRCMFYRPAVNKQVGGAWLYNSVYARKPAVISQYDFSIPDRQILLAAFCLITKRDLRNEKITCL